MIIRILLLLVISGCSATASHVGDVTKVKKGEYSIQDVAGGFIVAGQYRDHQGLRNSKSAFQGCAGVINAAAKAHSNDTVKYPDWDEITIVDHGRDIITAIMRVNCRFEYRTI